MTVNLTTLVRIAGLLHFCILTAGALTPRVLDWKNDLRQLHPMTRQLIWVHGAFIILTIIAFGLISTIYAPTLAAGQTQLARAICAFIAVFWGARLALQFIIFNPGPLLSSLLLKLGYHGLTVVFLYFAITFGWAAARPI